MNFPNYLKSNNGECIIKRIDAHTHCTAFFAKREEGHFECFTNKIRTDEEFDSVLFESCEPASEQEYIELVKKIAEFQLKILEHFKILNRLNP